MIAAYSPARSLFKPSMSACLSKAMLCPPRCAAALLPNEPTDPASESSTSRARGLDGYYSHGKGTRASHEPGSPGDAMRDRPTGPTTPGSPRAPGAARSSLRVRVRGAPLSEGGTQG